MRPERGWQCGTAMRMRWPLSGAAEADSVSATARIGGHKKTGPFDPVSSNTTETRKQTRSPRRPRRDQNPLPICANTVALLPPSWPTVTLAPRLASRPNSLVRAPNSKVP